MLLDWLARRHKKDEYAKAARAIGDAVDVLLAKPETRTVDLGGSTGTAAFTKLLIHHITKSV